MNTLLRYWGWITVSLLFAVVTGFLLFAKMRKGPELASFPKDESSCKGTEGLQLHKDVGRNEELAKMLQVLFVRTGLDPEEAYDQLVAWSILNDSRESEDSSAASAEPPERSLTQRDLGKELEQAIQAGLAMARQGDDDYSHVGIEYEESGAEGVEVQLVDERASRQLELYVKLASNLQQMYGGGEFPNTRLQMEEILANLQHRIMELRDGMTYRTTLEDSEFGSSSDRRRYYFQVGVVQYLRSKGVFSELKGLYRPGTTESALDFKVQEVYAFLRTKNEVFALAEQLGIQRLLQAGEAEIKALVEKGLPEHLS